MVETGILTAEDKVELLENYVVLKKPRNPRHDSTLQRMLRPLLTPLPPGWDLLVQAAIVLLDSQPEPDYTFVRGSAVDYETRHPGPADIGLLIEVAIPRCSAINVTRRASMPAAISRVTGS